MNATQAKEIAAKVSDLMAEMIGYGSLFGGDQYRAALALSLLKATRPPVDWKRVRVFASIEGDGFEHAEPDGGLDDDKVRFCRNDTHRGIIEAWIPPVAVPVVEGTAVQ